MKTRRSWSILFALALLQVGCTRPLPSQVSRSATPSPFFPSAPSATSSATQTPASTATPRDWLPPNFGTPGPTQVTAVPLPADPIGNSDAFNILLVGADRASPSFRTDTLILVNFQPEFDLVTLVSIPRDLYVYIPGWQMQRINAAYYRGESKTFPYPGGGPGLLKDTMLYNLGIQVDRVALVDFDGFVNIIDILGGVDVPVACAYTDWKIINPNRNPEDEDNWSLYTLDPGVVHMDGDLAFWYVRARKKSSDFDRGRRQQEVLRAAPQPGPRLDTLAKAPELYEQLSSSLTTDLDLRYLLELLPHAAELSRAHVRSVYINKDVLISWRTPQGAAVLLPDSEKLGALLGRALGPPGPAAAASENLVEILNGTDNSSWSELAGERLSYAGFDSLVAEYQGGAIHQTVLVGLATEVDEEEVDFLLQSLGLSVDRFEHEPERGSAAQYRLILGEDYQPCFDPASIER
ncbi:MAG: LCP family protein [Chloroflexi bacterium]|nr:LCP family protein [Chloroflexota bacterium]